MWLARGGSLIDGRKYGLRTTDDEWLLTFPFNKELFKDDISLFRGAQEPVSNDPFHEVFARKPDRSRAASQRAYPTLNREKMESRFTRDRSKRILNQIVTTYCVQGSPQLYTRITDELNTRVRNTRVVDRNTGTAKMIPSRTPIG